MAARPTLAATPVHAPPRAPRVAPACMSPRDHVTTVAGTPIAWTEQGAGENLVLIHGIGDSRRTWRIIAPLLARHYRVLMPDLPGHGDSGRPDAPYTLTWFAQMLSDWMKAIRVRHAHVVGHSFGGGVAQWLVLDHRARVDRLALIAAGGLGREVGIGLRLASLPFPERLCTPSAMWLGTLLGVLLTRQSFGNPPMLEIRSHAHLNGIRGTGRAFCRTVRGVVNVFGQSVQTRDGFTAIVTLPPIALFWGAGDQVIPVEHGRLALQLFQGATLKVFPGCGHYPHLQEPRKVATALLAFLGNRHRTPVRLVAPIPVAILPPGKAAIPVLLPDCGTVSLDPRWHAECNVTEAVTKLAGGITRAAQETPARCPGRSINLTGRDDR